VKEAGQHTAKMRIDHAATRAGKHVNDGGIAEGGRIVDLKICNKSSTTRADEVIE